MDSCISLSPIRWQRKFPTPETPVRVPQGVTDGVPKETYDTYRAGRDSACVDLMIVTSPRFGGEKKVVLSKRKETVCYGGKWWMQGGALGAYQSIENFITQRVKTECGIDVSQFEMSLVGVFRTGAPDHIGSTLQICYAARVPESVTQQRITDAGHSAVRLFSKKEISEVPESEQHWYPMTVAGILLR